MQEDYLCHHGVKGMKWGRRKDRRTSSSGGIRKKAENLKKSVSNKVSNTKKRIKKTLDKVDKEKIKKVAKTTTIVAGSVAVSALLGNIGGQVITNYTEKRFVDKSDIFGSEKYLDYLKRKHSM